MMPLQRKTVLVTGGAQGLGRAAAEAFARAGMRVIIADIQAERGAAVVDELRQIAGHDEIEGVWGDLSSRRGVELLADAVQDRCERLDVLLNNVGGTFLKYQESPDGIELTWALNYLGHLHLISELLPLLRLTAIQTGDVRIVEVVSSIYRFSSSDYTRRQQRAGYQGVLAYAHSKRALITMTYALHRKLRGQGVSINAVTPGGVKTHIANDSGFARIMMSVIHKFMLPVEEGVKPIVHLAVAPEMKGVSGQYFKRFKQQGVDTSAQCGAAATQLFEVSEPISI